MEGTTCDDFTVFFREMGRRHYSKSTRAFRRLGFEPTVDTRRFEKYEDLVQILNRNEDGAVIACQGLGEVRLDGYYDGGFTDQVRIEIEVPYGSSEPFDRLTSEGFSQLYHDLTRVEHEATRDLTQKLEVGEGTIRVVNQVKDNLNKAHIVTIYARGENPVEAYRNLRDILDKMGYSIQHPNDLMPSPQTFQH